MNQPLFATKCREKKMKKNIRHQNLTNAQNTTTQHFSLNDY